MPRRQGDERLFFGDVGADPSARRRHRQVYRRRIMAYWGPPFTADADQARLAGLAALDGMEARSQANASWRGPLFKQ
jgi:hypothetical protein